MRALTIALLALAVPIGAAAQPGGAIKPGEWEFSTSMMLPGTDGPAVTHRQCIDPDRAVPIDPRPQCNITRIERQNSLITWSSTCEAAAGRVDTAGSARYSGDTMQADLNTRVSDGHGGVLNTKQHVTGRYVGPCPVK